MKIWLINNYAMLPEHGPMSRQYYFAKNLAALGHEVIAFGGSHVHNTELQLLEKGTWKLWQESPFRWVYVHTLAYRKSRKKQVLSMFQFYRNMAKTAAHFRRECGTPDVILGSSAHPLAALFAVRWGKKYGCKSIVEIRDLWPESIVAYGIAGEKNPAVLLLRRLEKYLYTHADAVVFTAEGAYDYITERGWEKDVPREKVHCINNGIDRALFEENRERCVVDDPDLDDADTFKVIYTGSLRLANNIGLLLDTAKLVKDPRIRFLIWGDGDEREALERRVRDEGIESVVFKGRVDKKYIPSIVSRADLNLEHSPPTPLFRFGVSANKLFEYFAAGKPVLCDYFCPYNPVLTCGAGIEVFGTQPQQIAATIGHLAAMSAQERQVYCDNARRAAEVYDFKRLSQKLLDVIESIL